MLIQNISRIQAFSLHLLLSALAFGTLVGICIQFWYPQPLFIIDGGWDGLKLVGLVDVVLGPLITLIIYNKQKKSLKLDISIIVAIQLTCLIMGAYIVHRERTIALVLIEDTFYTVSRADKVTPEDIERIPGPSPKLITLDLPKDNVERRKVMVTNSLFASLLMASSLYTPYESKKHQNLTFGIPFMEYYNSHPDQQPLLKQHLNSHQLESNDVVLYKVQGKYSSSAYIVNKKSANIIDHL